MLRIRELRLENNLTQKELAEKISSTSKNIWAYENQISIPPLDVLIKLADFFNCSIDYAVVFHCYVDVVLRDAKRFYVPDADKQRKKFDKIISHETHLL